MICQEPVCKFLACLEQHALIRELPTSTAYWVCAYANNQHCVAEDIKSNPRNTSFYRAMQMCQGVLLVLDSAGTPFQRIWCCFEESIARASGKPFGNRSVSPAAHFSLSRYGKKLLVLFSRKFQSYNKGGPQFTLKDEI